MIVNAEQKDLDYARENALYDNVKEYPPLELTGWSKTLIIDDEIIAVGGVVVFWPGVGEAWLQLTKHAEKHKIALVRCVRLIMALAFKELNLHRMEATATFDEARKFNESMGFKCETPDGMRKYTQNGKTAYLYSIVR